MVDYLAMTGRKADALAFSSVEPRPMPKHEKRRPSSEHPHGDHDEDGNQDMDNDEEPPTESWNVFDPVRTFLSDSSPVSRISEAISLPCSWIDA